MRINNVGTQGGNPVIPTHTKHWKNTYKRNSKPLPPYGASFQPAKGMIPATVYVGSHDAISAVKRRLEAGIKGLCCLPPGAQPSAYRWDFLRGLPVIVRAPDDLAREYTQAVVMELATAGARDIAAISDTGTIIAVYGVSMEATQ
jgi:hypothetical protein